MGGGASPGHCVYGTAVKGTSAVGIVGGKPSGSLAGMGASRAAGLFECCGVCCCIPKKADAMLATAGASP